MKAPTALIPLLLLAACTPKPPEPTTSTVKVAETAPIVVNTSAAKEQPMPRYLRVTGGLRGAQQALVAADVAGKVVAAPIERGSVVKQGEVLIKLDDRTAKLSLQEAEASLAETQLKLDLANSEFTRNEPLAKTGAISATTFEKLKIDRASAEASLAAITAKRDQARKALDDCTLRAPFAGTVAERLTEVGEYVANNTQVVSLVATQQLRLELNVPETAAGQIKEDQLVDFAVPAYANTRFNGKIKFIGASVRESARDLIVEAVVDNADGRLKPGMFAEGRIALSEVKSVTIPTSALRVEGNTRKVFVVHNDQIEERLVEVGESKDGQIEIRRGISTGEAVVTAPGADAADGVKVTLTAQL